MSHSYRDLIGWQRAVALVTDLYQASRSFPREELYGLTSQLRRAAGSVACNIAEGQGRKSVGEFQMFLGHARGSLFEVETLLLVAYRLGYLPEARYGALAGDAGEVGRILNGLIASLDSRRTKGVKRV